MCIKKQKTNERNNIKIKKMYDFFFHHGGNKRRDVNLSE